MNLLVGDCVEEMAKMPADSVDAIVTDPPYGLEFMGKEWDRLDTRQPDDSTFHRSGVGPFDRAKVRHSSAASYGGNAGRGMQAWHETWAREAFRVLKPGGHLLAFGGTRTYHRMVCAIEDAGFEIRDSLHWVYGSGFPKSKNVGDGWGTALKPAHEPICVARKPLSEKNVAQNVLKHGTGAINVDGCRVGVGNGDHKGVGGGGVHSHWHGEEVTNKVYGNGRKNVGVDHSTGRWPPNLLLSHHPDCKPTGEVRRVKPGNGSGRASSKSWQNPSAFKSGGVDNPETTYLDPDGTEPQEVWECVEGCPAAEMDRQSGQSKRNGGVYTRKDGLGENFMDDGWQPPETVTTRDYPDQGGASRFFPRFETEAPFRYQAKASRRERNAGLEGMPETAHRSVGEQGQGPTPQQTPRVEQIAANHHLTVKPIGLMRWLVRLVTPPGGTVLDPFAGSGSTGCAAVQEGVNFIGIEMDAEYAEIARRRIEHHQKQREEAPLTLEV